MALEDALLKLAEAINNHAEALKSTTGKAPVAEKAKVEPQVKKDTSATTVEKPQGTQTDSATSAEKTTSSSTETTDTPAVTPDTSAPDVDVAELKAKFLALVNKDRAAAEGVLTALGFPKLNLIPANLHAKAWELITEALNG